MKRTRTLTLCGQLGLVGLLLGGGGVSTAQAQETTTTKADKLVADGDELFKDGFFFRASEKYRMALLEDPSSPWKKLAFGHALFAIGNYSYASYALRRGVSDLDRNQEFAPELATLFPNRRRFTQAVRDLKRYVTYSPRERAGLTVLGYVLFTVKGEERRCRDMFRYLQRLDRKDPFAAFFLKQLKLRSNAPARVSKPKRAPFALFLNGFSETDAARIKAALKRETEFPGVLPGGGNAKRIVIEFGYTGKNLQVSIARVLRELEIGVRFKEAELPNHIEAQFVPPPPPEPKPKPKAVVKPTPKPAPKPKTNLKQVIPEPTPPKEKLEDEWPAPTPAPSR